MPLILGANSVSGYTVKNSLRFNSGSSDYLSRTPSSTGNRRTFTISCWIKRATLTASGKNIMVAWSGAKSGASFGSAIYFNSSDQIEVDHDIAGSDYTFNTNMVFRDVGAWYHIVLAVDTTQATSANRQTIYVNGSSVALTATALGFPIQNFDTYFNFLNGENDIGSDYFTAGYADQYMSEFYLIDGQALTPSSFGETDTDTGIWIPKAYTGTYGTNGFFLKFLNSASLGTDSSGNGNNFTVNNLTSIDQTTDTPTNNFCTINPLVAGSTGFTEGNLKWTNTSGGWSQRLATFMFSAGKWYAEMKVDTKGDTVKIGIQLPTLLDTFGGGELNNSYFYLSDGRIRNNGANVTTGLSTFTDGDIIGIAVDVTNSLLYFYKNGTLVNSGGTSITSGQDWVIGCGAYDAGTDNVVSWNFGNPPYSANSYTDGAGYGNFSYSVPSGFYSLCTKNLYQYGF